MIEQVHVLIQRNALKVTYSQSKLLIDQKNLVKIAPPRIDENLTRLTWLIHTSVLPSNWNPGKIFALTV